VRRAAKVLKKKDPKQLFSRLCQPLVELCAELAAERKNSHAKRKTDQLHNSGLRNHPATPHSNKLHRSSAKL
jgi:hypothetical protein